MSCSGWPQASETLDQVSFTHTVGRTSMVVNSKGLNIAEVWSAGFCFLSDCVLLFSIHSRRARIAARCSSIFWTNKVTFHAVKAATPLYARAGLYDEILR